MFLFRASNWGSSWGSKQMDRSLSFHDQIHFFWEFHYKCYSLSLSFSFLLYFLSFMCYVFQTTSLHCDNGAQRIFPRQKSNLSTFTMRYAAWIPSETVKVVCRKNLILWHIFLAWWWTGWNNWWAWLFGGTCITFTTREVIEGNF